MLKYLYYLNGAMHFIIGVIAIFKIDILVDFPNGLVVATGRLFGFSLVALCVLSFLAGKLYNTKEVALVAAVTLFLYNSGVCAALAVSYLEGKYYPIFLILLHLIVGIVFFIDVLRISFLFKRRNK